MRNFTKGAFSIERRLVTCTWENIGITLGWSGLLPYEYACLSVTLGGFTARDCYKPDTGEHVIPNGLDHHAWTTSSEEGESQENCGSQIIGTWLEF